MKLHKICLKLTVHNYTFSFKILMDIPETKILSPTSIAISPRSRYQGNFWEEENKSDR